MVHRQESGKRRSKRQYIHDSYGGPSLQISNLDLIEIIAIGDNGDRASLDYIEFVKAAELPTQAPSVDLPSHPLRLC